MILQQSCIIYIVILLLSSVTNTVHIQSEHNIHKYVGIVIFYKNIT